MTASRYTESERRRDDVEQAQRSMYSPRTVGESQVWHRCAVLLGWRWESGRWTNRHMLELLDEAQHAKDACELSGVCTLRDACILLRDAST